MSALLVITVVVVVVVVVVVESVRVLSNRNNSDVDSVFVDISV